MGKIEETIAEFIVGTNPEAIPEDCYRVVRDGCFDCVGVMLAGAAEPHGRVITDFVRREGAPGPCTVVGTDIRTAPAMAALANGTLAHALDYDDMGGFGHPSAVLFPAALAVAELTGASGRDLVAAYVVGFEVACHLSRGANYVQGERGFHSTAVFGTLGATAAACRLLGLDRRRTVMALGIAASTPSGVLQNFGTHTKPLHAGLAARHGVMAALLARDGFLSSPDALAGPIGWAAAYLGEGRYDVEKMVRDLGKVWLSRERIVIKKYPCCGSNHSALDSLLGLMKDYGFKAEDVEEVEVYGLPGIAHVLLYPEPEYAFQGKFSINYCLASALVDGQLDIGSFNEEKLARPELKEALGKVEVKILPRWDPAYSHHPAETPVVVRLRDGRVLRRSTNRHTMRGSVTDPLTAEELWAKFRANGARSLPETQVEKALRLWWSLPELSDLKAAAASVARV
jgi:2-methylcitrate dehydratase PrpD